MKRTPIEQSNKQQLSKPATRLRKEGRDTPPGVERTQQKLRARDAKWASQVNGWLNSHDLRPPK